MDPAGERNTTWRSSARQARGPHHHNFKHLPHELPQKFLHNLFFKPTIVDYVLRSAFPGSWPRRPSRKEESRSPVPSLLADADDVCRALRQLSIARRSTIHVSSCTRSNKVLCSPETVISRTRTAAGREPEARSPSCGDRKPINLGPTPSTGMMSISRSRLMTSPSSPLTHSALLTLSPWLTEACIALW